MELFEYLGDYRKRADGFLEEFFRGKEEGAFEFGTPSLDVNVTLESVRRLEKYCVPGKKVRGFLVETGYRIGGGREDVLSVSLAMELLHAFGLIHDDIMDRDETRRGMKTVHTQFAELGVTRDGAHYGTSMAIQVGDLSYTWAWELLALFEASAECKRRAFVLFGRMIEETIYGQMLDVSLGDTQHVTEDEIMKVYLSKSAWYTISGPLQLGAVLAGGSDEVLDAMRIYGENVGVAFQMRDDELGLFGDAEALGKPVGSDVRENKHTLLKMKVMELADEDDAEFLQKMYGNSGLSEGDLERIRDIHRTSGALAYSEERCRELVQEGKRVVPEITGDVRLQKVLLELADYVVTRDK